MHQSSVSHYHSEQSSQLDLLIEKYRRENDKCSTRIDNLNRKLSASVKNARGVVRQNSNSKDLKKDSKNSIKHRLQKSMNNSGNKRSPRSKNQKSPYSSAFNVQHLGRNLHDYHDSSDNQRTPERIDGKKRPLIINTQGGVSTNLRLSQNNL